MWYPARGARPRCEVEGERCLLEARLVRCFPLSEPDQFLSLRDGAGNEVGILRSLNGMDPESREVAENELDRRYFTPAIERITALKQEASMWRWDVETQHGPITFYLRGVRDSIHEVAPRRWQVMSIDGQRYEIRDYARLDDQSRNLFDSLF